MSDRVIARDIDAMRRAQYVTLTEANATAVLTCQSTSVPRPFVDPITIPIRTDGDDLGASPARGGDTLALSIRRARRNPTWAALVNTVRDGDQLKIQWERNGYALLLVLSDGEIVDRFSFPATRSTRRALNPRPWQPSRPTRVLAALADVAGRVPLPRRSRSAAPDASGALAAAGEAAQPTASEAASA